MATTYDIRRVNLSLLINMKYGGVASRLAEKMGRKPSYLSRMFMKLDKGGRNMGDKLARDIEEATDLPAGWLDVVRPDEYLQFLPDTPPRSRENASNAVRELIVQNVGEARFRRTREAARQQGRQDATAAFQDISEPVRNVERYLRTERREWNPSALMAVIQGMQEDQLAKMKAALMIADIPEAIIDALAESKDMRLQSMTPEEQGLVNAWRRTNHNGHVMIANVVRAAQVRFPLPPEPTETESPASKKEADLFDFKDFPPDSGKAF